MKHRNIVPRGLALLLALLVSQQTWLLAVTRGPELPNPGNVGVSKQEQEQLGLKVAADVYKQMPVLPDSDPVSQYVQQLGRKLQKVIPQQYSWPYQFHVVQQKEINAFALPGGPIFINAGTITAADNEAELAGVMAHEMSHVYMQHSMKAMKKQGLTQGIAGIAGAILGSVIGGTAGGLANAAARYTGAFFSLKYSREDEAQADAVGAIIMWKASYDPRAMAEFFQKLEKQGGAGGPQFLSDHPNPGNRVAAVEKEIRDWPHKNYQSNNQYFAQAKQRTSSIKAYTAQEIANGAKQGLWAQQNKKNNAIPPDIATAGAQADSQAPSGNVVNVSYDDIRPSSNFKRLNENGLSIAYPENWQVFRGQNGLTIAPPSGASQDAIAYGVVIGSGQDQNASTLDQATDDLIRSLQQSNPNLRVEGNPQRVTVNGIQGRSVDLIGVSPVQRNGQPLQEHDWLVTLPSSQAQQGFYYLIFIAPENDFSRLRPTYEKMLDSLQVQ